jgi:hypothetical protein
MAGPLRGRLMVGRLTLDQVVKVRVLAPQLRKPRFGGVLFLGERWTLRSRMQWVQRSFVAVLAIAFVTGCNPVKKPYDTPRARVDGDQAVALLKREVKRRTPARTFAKAQKVATQTPSGRYAWLVRLSNEGADAVCGYVWRGEEAGRADGTVIRIQFDHNCRHWTN